MTTQSVSYVKDLLDAKGLYNITSMEKLVLAMNARQDETFKRLKHDSATGTWLTDKMPKMAQ